MRQLIRRVRTCEAGAGLVEYSLIVAVVAICLIGILKLYREAVGGLTNKTAVTISAQAGSGYGSSAGMGGPPVRAGHSAQEPDPADPDSSATQESPSHGGTQATAATLLKP